MALAAKDLDDLFRRQFIDKSWKIESSEKLGSLRISEATPSHLCSP